MYSAQFLEMHGSWNSVVTGGVCVCVCVCVFVCLFPPHIKDSKHNVCFVVSCFLHWLGQIMVVPTACKLGQFDCRLKHFRVLFKWQMFLWLHIVYFLCISLWLILVYFLNMFSVTFITGFSFKVETYSALADM
jgi:hypothetical protein